MRCIYCESEIVDGEIYCNKCGKAVQMVPDYNEFEDDYIDGLVGITQKEQKKLKQQKIQEEKRQKKIKAIEEQNKKQKQIIIALLAVVCTAVIVLIAVIAGNVKNKNSNSAEYQINKAHKALEKGLTDEAVSYFEKAISLDENNTDIKMELAGLFDDQKNYSGAAILYKEVIDIDNMNEAAYKALIRYYDSNKDYDSIIDLSKGVKSTSIMKLFDEYIVTPPIFSLESGEYEDSLKLKLTSSSKADIYYSFDDANPYEDGDKYNKEILLEEIGEFKITAVCVNSKGICSEPAQEEFVIISSAPDMPSVTPDGGSFITDSKAYVDVPSNCNAYYTWDGTDPTIESELYVDGISIPEGNNVLSVVLINDKGKVSEVYKNRFEYYKSE